MVECVTTGESGGTLSAMLMRSTGLETNAINAMCTPPRWTPRIRYGLVILWMAYGLLNDDGFTPKVAKDL